MSNAMLDCPKVILDVDDKPNEPQHLSFGTDVREVFTQQIPLEHTKTTLKPPVYDSEILNHMRVLGSLAYVPGGLLEFSWKHVSPK